ncbi:MULTISPECIES: trypsin-like serine protease [unclassified Streptomyces]|uniref:trypsin-like serine protease n=1 Tax=unclassified Streptomyces TaxID=2593676 RepID=UPI0037F34EAF
MTAAGVAAAVAGALFLTPAQAASNPPSPARPASATASAKELNHRLAVATAGDDLPGATSRSALSGAADTRTGRIDPKIIGGTTTTIAKAPWMAQLWYGDDRGTASTADDIGFFCGGAVVAPTKILTAAHCVKGYNWKAHGTAVVGATTLADADSLHGGTAVGVWRQWNHPSYNSVTIDNDIAVLTLNVPVKVTPIRMTTAADTASYKAGTAAKVYGWGRTTSTTQDLSATLKTADLPIRSDATCAGFYGADFIKGHNVCAGAPASGSDTGTTSSCNGDSGGPLVVGGRIAGVVSWGVRDCVARGAYSVFTKVSTYVGVTYPRLDDTNLSGDHYADLWMRTASGRTGYERDSKGTSLAGRESWGDWSGFDLVLQTDLDRDDYQDLLVRRASDGDVFWKHFVPSRNAWSTKLVGDNWKSRLAVLAPGDVTGDYQPDLVSVDSAGVLWVYPGKGNGTFAARVKAGTGWKSFSWVRGHGDFSGDGIADLVARKKSNGAVYLYKGRGNGTFAAGVKIATWSGSAYNAFAAVGDVNGDSRADFLARTPGGTLYLLRGTGKSGSAAFAARLSLGTTFKQYDLFG